MRFSHLNKFKIGNRNFTIFLSLAETQTLEGMTDKAGKDKHYVFGDIEGCNLAQTVAELKPVQKKYVLSDIFVVSDAENSFRYWCWSKVDFKTLLKILLDIPHLDYNFFFWTVQRGKATLRVSNKVNRPAQKVVAVLYSYSVPFPETVEKVIYDTGVQKRGLTLIFKDGKAVLKGDLRNG
jgi:hypothetical protein